MSRLMDTDYTESDVQLSELIELKLVRLTHFQVLGLVKLTF